MEILELLKSKKTEIVEKTIALLPSSLTGDKANRSFYVSEDEDGVVEVGYYYYAGQCVLDDSYFYTIKDYETPEPEDYGYENYEEMDFDACGFTEQIENAIENQIGLLEEY